MNIRNVLFSDRSRTGKERESLLTFNHALNTFDVDQDI